MTQILKAKQGIITKEMEFVADKEKVDVKLLMEQIAKGSIIIPVNKNHKNLNPMGIGKGLKTKINANIGSSKIRADINEELNKLHFCIKYGADTVMDLSTGGNLNQIRETLIQKSPIPLGTVPLYQVVEECNLNIEEATKEDFLDIIELHAKQGVDYMTIHAGLVKSTFPYIKKRITGIVSRGGALIYQWMKFNNQENPLFTQFDQICEIFHRYDVSFSLGDSLRPGSLHDATDEAQLAELRILGDLTLKAWKNDCQVMIEGPGHIPMHDIKKNVDLEKKYCHNAPFYVLGPLVIDISPGYDHISSAIGAAIAGWHGADMLCYVTAAEHLGLPNPDQVREGIIAYKIAAHAADISKGIPNARAIDDELSRARFSFDWEKQFSLALDPEKAAEIRSDLKLNADFCGMCGPNYCSMKNFSEAENIKTFNQRNLEIKKKKIEKDLFNNTLMIK